MTNVSNCTQRSLEGIINLSSTTGYKRVGENAPHGAQLLSEFIARLPSSQSWLSYPTLVDVLFILHLDEAGNLLLLDSLLIGRER